jgi:hypothetical protein
MFVVPLQRKSPTVEVRVWLALVLGFECLQAYPVAGSQLNWGSYLIVPLLVLALQDAAPWLRPRMAGLRAWPGRAGAVLGVTTILLLTGQLLQRGSNWYVHSQQLGLPGAERMRLPNDITCALRIANENLRAHSDLLCSLPGLYSANVWTGLATPTLANTTHWFSLLSAAQQQAIIDQLASHPRAAVLVQREILDLIRERGFRPQGLLYTWLTSHFVPALGFGGYEIWVWRGRHIAPLSLANLERRPDGLVRKLTLTLPPTSVPIARIEVCSIDRPESPLLTFPSESTTATLTPCDLSGNASGHSSAVSFPVAVESLSQLELTHDGISFHGPLRGVLLVARDSTGKTLRELLVNDPPDQSTTRSPLCQ